jgi:hypothetical protein
MSQPNENKQSEKSKHCYYYCYFIIESVIWALLITKIAPDLNQSNIFLISLMRNLNKKITRKK